MHERLEARQKFIWDMNTARSNAIKEGRQIGLEEGREEGKAEGRAEGIHQVALNMLSKSMDPATISELTGLSLEEINNLH